MQHFFVARATFFCDIPRMADTREILERIADGRTMVALARHLGVDLAALRSWRIRRRIPPRWHSRVIEFAARQGITVTEDELR